MRSNEKPNSEESKPRSVVSRYSTGFGAQEASPRNLTSLASRQTTSLFIFIETFQFDQTNSKELERKKMFNNGIMNCPLRDTTVVPLYQIPLSSAVPGTK